MNDAFSINLNIRDLTLFIPFQLAMYCLCGFIFLFMPRTVQAEYPEKKIQLLVPFSPSGESGRTALALAPLLSKYLDGVTVEVKNIVGNNGANAYKAFSQASPDGYTLMLGSASELVYYAALDFDLNRYLGSIDFIDVLNRQPLVCVTQKNSKFADWRHFFDVLKHHPKSLRHARGGPTEALFPLYLSKLLRSNYDQVQIVTPQSGQTALNLLETDKADFFCATLSYFSKHILRGEVAPIFSNSAKEISRYPSIPFAHQIGLRGIEKFTFWTALITPKNTPPIIVNRIRKALIAIADDPQWKATEMTELGGKTIGKMGSVEKFIQEEAVFFEMLVSTSLTKR